MKERIENVLNYQIENLEKLTKFINDLETLPNITFVERIIK